MKKTIRKRLCVMIVLFALICNSPVNAYAEDVTTIASGKCGDDITWTLDSNGLLTISGSGFMTDYKNSDGMFPKEECPWYSRVSQIQNICIDGNIENIGNDAFEDCSNVKNIIIPDSVTSIGLSAFSGCSSLTSITIPDSVTSIGLGAFSGCSSLTSIAIPDGVTSIESSTFQKCSSLTSITIPDSVTSIESWAFYGCSSLTSITIPDSVTSIGSWAFKNCSKLNNITLPKNITTIENNTFDECDSLKSIVIPDSVTNIGSGAFSYCRKLNDVTLPKNLITIDSSAFFYCISLKNIIIPNSVTSIGRAAFCGCGSIDGLKYIQSVFYNGTSTQWDSIAIGESNEALIKSPVHFSTTEHTWNPDYTVDTEPTCIMAGSQSIHCSVCDIMKEDSSIPIPVNVNHTTELRNEKEPTYTSTGYTGDQVCTICEKIIEAGTVIPAKERIEATGKFALLKTFLKERGLIDSDGNRYFQNTTTIDNLKSVTTISYLEDEAQFKFYQQSYSNDKKTSTISMRIEENGSQTVTVNYSFDALKIHASATFAVEHYTDDGTEYFEQTSSSMFSNSEIQDMCNSTLKAAFSGWKIILIKNFGFDLTMGDMGFTSYQEPGTHTWDDGEVTANATCEKNGIKTYTCLVCKETATEIIPAKGHHWDHVTITKVINATTGETKTYKTYTCSVCKKNRKEIVPAKKGTIITEKSGSTYKVTKAGTADGTVEITQINSSSSTIIVPDAITSDGITYKVTSIAANAFKGNKKITKITIGKNVSKIGKNAFNGCTKLKRITIKTTKLTTKNVGSNAFKNISKKASVKVPSKKLKAYKKLLKKRGITGKKQKIKK